MFYYIMIWINGILVGGIGIQLIYSPSPSTIGNWLFGGNLVIGIVMLVVDHNSRKKDSDTSTKEGNPSDQLEG